MRVLVASKFWYPRGGLERVMFGEIEALEKRGIEFAHFSTQHPDNISSPWESYFAPYSELGGGAGLGARESATAAWRMFANAPAARVFSALLDEFGPDLVHVHGIHRQISPSILFAAKSRGIPVVQSLHDAHHVCPADVLLRGGREVCDPRSCGVYNYLPAITNRCVRGSAAASALSAAETTFQRVRRAYERTVTRFVAPSRYLARVMSEGGWDGVPIDVLPNGVSIPATTQRSPSGYFLVAGRLSAEKGVAHALDAARRGGQRVIVAGTGPLSEALQADFPEAQFVGHVSPERVGELLDSAIASVVPSVVPENAPMSVLEAMARGVPVVAVSLGGIPELVSSRSGILVEPGDVDGLSRAMHKLADDPLAASEMGRAGRERVAAEFTINRHAEALLTVYETALTSTKGTR